MTATIELNDRLIGKAKKLTGITENSKVVNEILRDYIRGKEFVAGMVKLKNSDGLWPGYDPKESK
jgi:Arc/MetJ family transcription regulator